MELWIANTLTDVLRRYAPKMGAWRFGHGLLMRTYAAWLMFPIG
jgi:hypothetical protein